MVSTMNNNLVAAINIGETYSGYAYTFMHDYNKDPTKMYISEWSDYCRHTSPRQPTCVLCDIDGKFHSFGYKAEGEYKKLAASNLHHNWYFFRRFPVHLNGKQVQTGMTIEDDKSLKMPAIKVFGMSISYIKNELLSSLVKHAFRQTKFDDIHWVLTVPAVWTQSAQQFMRDAANEADIDGGQLTIALEPNAAATYFKMLSSNHHFGMENFDDTKYIVMDINDEAVDISVYEKQEDETTREVHKVCCGPWDNSSIDEEFTKMIIHIFGAPTVSEFCEEHKDKYQDMLKSLKKAELQVTTDTDCVYINISNVLETIYRRKYGKSLHDAIKQSQFGGKITQCGLYGISIDNVLFMGFLQNCISKITEHLTDFLSTPCVMGTSSLLMVGELSKCEFLKECIRKTFPKVLIPYEAVMVVAKGAVVLGTSLYRASKEDEHLVSSDDIDSLSSSSNNSDQVIQNEGGMNLKCKSLSDESEQVSNSGCVEINLRQAQGTTAVEHKLKNQMKLTEDVGRAPSDDELFTLSRKLYNCQKEWWVLAKLLGLSDDIIDEMERSGGHIVRQYYKMLTAWRRQNTEQEKCSIRYLLKSCNEAGIDRQLTMNAFK